MQNILVTGGCGFIGSHLVDRLLKDGHNVIVLDNLSSGRNLNPNTKLYELDISQLSTNELVVILEKHEINYVFHLAAQINLRHSFIDPTVDAQTNIMGTLNLLRASIKANADRFVFSSTGGAMYSENASMPWNEKSDISPKSPYALSKFCAEQYIKLLLPEKHVILRFANVYGPRQNPHGEAGVVSIFMNNLTRGLPCKIFGDGKQIRDYIFVDDVINACITSMLISPGTYNVSTGIGTDLNTLALMILSESDISGSIKYEPPIPGEMKKSVLDYKKLSTNGWQPKTSLLEGLKKTIDYVKDNQ